MKIIASSKIDINYIEGIMFVLTKLGHDCILWDDKKKPLFNMLDEQNPEVLFLTPNEQKYLQLAQQEKKIKVVFVGKEEPVVKSDLWILPRPYANTIKYQNNWNRKEKHILETAYHYDLIYFSDTPITKNQFSILVEISKIKIRMGIFGNVRLPLYEYLGIVLKSERTLLINNCKAGIDFCGNSFLDFALFNKPCLTFFDNPIFFPVKNNPSINDLMTAGKLKVEVPKQFIYDNKLTDCHITSEIFDKLGYKEIRDKCLSLLE